MSRTEARRNQPPSRTRIPLPWLLALAALLWPLAASGAQPEQPWSVAKHAPLALALHQEGSGLTRPVLMVSPPDDSGRRMVVEQPGRITMLQPDGGLTPFLDITHLVKSGGERGLLGLAFSPDFAHTRRFYLYYTDHRGDIVIARATTLLTGLGDPGSITPLLKIHNPASNHNGGMIAFGPDGMLYIGTGDGGGAGNPYQTAQNGYSHLGKLLRIDVDGTGDHYKVPRDNPFVGRSRYRPEVWAIGLRNPWRFSFDSQNGDLFIADVGQDSWEEINHQPAGAGAGADYGWSRKEGRHCFPPKKRKRCGDSLQPVAEYGHDQGCSISGGFVYRGSAIPALRGVYLYSDYCSGTLWGLVPKKGRAGAFNKQRYLETDLRVSGFGQDGDGELYLLGHRQGAVYRIVPAAGRP